MRYFVRISASLVVLLALAACGADGKKTVKSCGSDAECSGGVCFDSQCYTSCVNQDQCSPDEFCVHKTSGGSQADVCVTASDFAGCAGDLDCESLVVRACEAARCETEKALCYVAAADDGVACTDREGTGTCKAGACEVDTSCVPTGADRDLCDGVDDDCDGGTDEDYVVTTTTCGVGACAATGHKVCEGGDEVDQCTAGTPAADDTTCDGVDDDCDGEADDGYVPVQMTCGVGACESPGSTVCVEGEVVQQCAPALPPADDDATCDGVDDDCDGETDEEVPDVVTTCGEGACRAGGALTCIDGELVDSCVPWEPASLFDTDCMGTDDDCDGETDEDFEPTATTCGVGVCAAEGQTACVDGEIIDACTPGQPLSALDDTCDGSDDDCDGETDEGFEPAATTCGVGPCAAVGEVVCVGSELVDSCSPGEPLSVDDVTCDGVDDDCNGVPDDGLLVELPDGAVVAGSGQPCGTGACAGGVTECFDGDGEAWLICSTLPPFSETAGETCNGADDDCDGLTDGADPDLEFDPGRECELSKGLCAGATRPLDHCQDGAWGACTTDDYLAWDPLYQAGVETGCDGYDNDCDGGIDDDFTWTEPDGTVLVGPGKDCGTGACAGGLTECGEGEVYCSTKHNAEPEQCNNRDDDCNGLTDEPQAQPCGADLICVTDPMFEGSACVQCFDGNEVRWDGCDYGTLAETQINETTANDEHRPSVAVLEDGGLAVTWTGANQETQAMHIFGKRYKDDGAAAVGEFQVSFKAGSSTSNRMSRVAPLAGGGFAVLWGADYTELVLRGYDASAQPVGDALSVAGPEGGPYAWDLAGDAKAGRIVAVWDAQNPLSYVTTLHGQAFDPDLATAWGPDFVGEKEPAGYEHDPRMAVFPDGQAVAVWSGGNGNVRVRLIGADGIPAEAIVDLVSPLADQGIGFNAPAVAAFRDGTFVVVYHETQYSEMVLSINAQRFGGDGKPLGEPVRVDTLTYDWAQAPEVAAFDDGGFVVVFPTTLYDSQMGADVYARWFLPDNQPVDVEKVVHTYLPGDQSMPRVAAFPDGRSVVAWASCDIYGAVSVAQDGSACGVYLQRFDPKGARITK